MKVTEFGVDHNETFMLLPGTSCTWEINFRPLVKPLSEKYHVLCVNYTGYDESGGIFQSMIQETEKIEAYIQEHFNGHITAVYGSSLGGSFASLLTQRKKIHIDHVFIGSSDLDQASPFVARLETALVWKLLSKYAKDPEKAAEKMKKKMEQKMQNGKESNASEETSGNFLALNMKGYLETIKNADPDTCKNQFYSDLITRIDDHISVEGTRIHVFYAEQMGEKYLKRYYQHYADPEIIPFPTGHEGWLGSPDLMIQTFQKSMQ